jgi:hypothetical protein
MLNERRAMLGVIFICLLICFGLSGYESLVNPELGSPVLLGPSGGSPL